MMKPNANKQSPINVLLAVLGVIVILLVILVTLKHLDEKEELRNEAVERVENLRSRIQGLPPGGELELLLSDLREAEKKLEGLR